MIIQHIGHAEFLIETENGFRIVTDPYDASTGYPVRKIKADAALVSHGHHDHNAVENLEDLKITVNREGSYTLSPEIKVTVNSFHDDEMGAKRGTNLLFMMEADGMKIVHLGDIGCRLEDEQIRLLAEPDVLMIPVGGFYTIDGKEAREIMDLLHPVVTIPMHYKTEYNSEWPISGPEVFLDGIPEKDIRRDIEVLRITDRDRECQPRVALFKA